MKFHAMAAPAVLVHGKKIKFRWAQSSFWGITLGAMAAAAVAGGYFNLFEVHWHLFLGPVQWRGFTLKQWWDNGMGVFHSKSWPLFRHGGRDDGEPALGIMAAFTVMAGPKYWGRRVSGVRLALTPPLFVVLAAAVAVFAAGDLFLAGISFAFGWVMRGWRDEDRADEEETGRDSVADAGV